MKNMFTKKVLLFLSITGFVACNKIDEFGNINQNPAATTEPILSALLTSTLSGLGNETWDACATASAGLITVSGFYCQYYSETLYTELSKYATPNINWDNYYAASLYDLQTIINYNSDPATSAKAAMYGSNNNQIGIARILKVYLFSLLTDCYGDLPYSGALKADNGIVAFDSQESLYTDFFKELNEAVAQFDNGNPATGDILFNGSITMWRRFANSLHALLALHLTKANPTLGAAEFKAALSSAGGVFEDGSNAEIKYPGVNYLNPVYSYHLYPPFRIAVSKTMTDWLQDHNDSRMNAYATSTTGFPYGVTRDSAISFGNTNLNWAKILKGQTTSANAPFPIITAAEIYLARAEAADLGWTNEDAITMYRNGIKESWQYWGAYNDADFETYMQQKAISLTGTVDDLKKINEQQWAAHYPNGLRGWTTWRRTGYPVLLPAPGSNSNAIPRRFPYGANEFSTNTENVNKAAALYTVIGTANSSYGKLWWDQ